MQASACNLSTRYNASPFPTLPLDRDIWRAYTSLPFHLAGVPRNLNGKSEAHDEGKISGCVRWRKRERERRGTRDRGILLWRKERRDERGGKTRSQSVAPTIPALYTHTEAAVAERRKRGEERGETRVVRWEKEDDSAYVETGWNVYVIRASCIISRLRVSLSPPSVTRPWFMFFRGETSRTFAGR